VPAHTGVLLDDCANNFERGRTDEFTLQCDDIGQVYKLLLATDGSGLGSDWHLARVIVRDSKRGSSETFPYDGWFSRATGLQQVRSPGQWDVYSGATP
jgi:lipoxygenase homology domain-containing protein 1